MGVGLALLLCCVALAALYYAGSRGYATLQSVPPAQLDTPAQLDQGRYLATLGNCVGCHTVPGGTPYAGGTAIPTAFGTLYGPNITPHP